uniref:hypothetical protein n=1 Tax=Limnohabitans sp. TaxID=1907725 RepID=UPI004047C4B8
MPDKVQMAREFKQNVWPILEAGTFKPGIHRVFDLAQAYLAHALMESFVFIGKIMLKVGDWYEFLGQAMILVAV